ncbi:sensor histidine kinase [Paenibacillus mucilaginosus]|uniref:Histidine kinase n=2 Tax=Paenibacillus mucilaginosus TaxID=61624 RepID=H6NNW5_9BACL|nr:sensor histidine kinase [Paenibacillus mucilaginosus]AEI42761.1 histidine kinase [Paenibacillus mucilaginosus KNP414]AFC30491.1 histidine kinase [Paenibacillus mucilaginosus 3016]MCG7216855.1 sensor histidine kinase [Paenibacillus mucilaginosus]WDM30953.1 sensor histidine kinase [Paenibacillus mucilaginosus]WFA19121.1 sensor histidine kinase [Paenibacillus mucilaginosus]
MGSMILAALRKTNNIRLKNKMVISIVAVVFIPVLLVGLILTASYRQNVLDQATQQTMNNVDKIKKHITDILRMPIEISNKLQVDDRLSNLVNARYETTFDLVTAYWDFRYFRDSVQLYKEIDNVRFYTDPPLPISNWDFLSADAFVKNSNWYREALDKSSSFIGWHYIKDETKENRAYLSLVRRIDFPLYRSHGVLVINLDQDELNGILSQEPFDTMIIDEKGSIVAAKQPQWVGRNIESMDFAKDLSDRRAGVYDFNYEGKPSKIVVEEVVPPFSRNGLKVISVFTIDSIVSDANRVSRLGFTIIAASLSIAIVLIYFTSSFLSRRLLLLNKVLNKVAMGNLNVKSDVDGNDEIGTLSRQFNHMLASIRSLMEEVSESHRQKNLLELRQRDIKLKMMASQMNPHFLFNALESIRMKAFAKGDAEISNVVHLLGKLMRRSIEIGDRKITLREELDIARCYLELQQFRFDDERLTYELHLDHSAMSVEIPPLIVQPLVENAVVHGLEDVEEGGIVIIGTRVESDRVVITVEDNGCGIPEGKWREIEHSFQDMEDADEHRIGLRNVHQRLILTYGEGFGLKLDCPPGSGTRLSFSIPLGGKLHV